MTPINGMDFILAGGTAVAAGMVNALAGGGTLITFPTLTALGLPAVASNVTNTVALCPGYLGATLAQAKDLRGQKRRLWICLPAGAAGGLLGGLLLLHTGERTFRSLVPFLILMASVLLAVQEPMKKWLAKRLENRRAGATEAWAAVPVGLAAVYGGYFGAGLSVIVLAVLGLVLEDTLTRLNALNQTISLATNVAAAVFFLFSGQVVWPAAAVMAAGALVGGAVGGRVAGRIRPAFLRAIIVSIGVIVSVLYWVR
jgi:uncharacterized membrane protein YfcA